MSNGITSMFERMQEEQGQRELASFNKIPDVEKIKSIKSAIRSLERFKEQSPALTESAWSSINDSLNELRYLVE